MFVIHVEGPPEKTIDAARNVWAQLADVRANGFTDEELNRARQLLEARFVRRLETMEGQANFLSEWEALGDWQLGERELERLMTATAAEVTDAVRRHLGEDSAGVIVYRPSAAAAVASDAHGDARGARKRRARRRSLPVPAPTPVRAAAAGARAVRARGGARARISHRVRTCRYSCCGGPARRSCSSACTSRAARPTSRRATPGSPR